MPCLHSHIMSCFIVFMLIFFFILFIIFWAFSYYFRHVYVCYHSHHHFEREVPCLQPQSLWSDDSLPGHMVMYNFSVNSFALLVLPQDLHLMSSLVYPVALAHPPHHILFSTLQLLHSIILNKPNFTAIKILPSSHMTCTVYLANIGKVSLLLEGGLESWTSIRSTTCTIYLSGNRIC